MKTVHVVTVAAGSDLPKARVLLGALRRHHPAWKLHVALADAMEFPDAPRGLGADEIHALESLGIPNLRRWAFCHSRTELSAAIKPFALGKLLARADCAAAIYLDPDIAMFAPMSEVEAALPGSDIVLTPQITAPEQAVPGIVAQEIPVMQQGIYTAGFIAIAAREEGRRFARWWSERTYRYCREDVPDGLYTDQRWVDFAPAFFDKVKVIRSAALYAAPWTLSSQTIAGNPTDGLTVNGAPLVFFHFSPRALSRGARSEASRSPTAELLNWYQAQIAPTPAEKASSPVYSFDLFHDGSPIALEQRLVYRSRPDVQRAHSDPFAAGEGSYLAWWKAHARAEYPRLFDPAAKAAEIQHLMAFLAYRRDGEDIVGDEARAPAKAITRAIARAANFIRGI